MTRKMKLMPVSEHLKQELKNPNFRETYELESLKAKIARELIEFRAKRGLTQAALARHAGVAQQEISRIENGDFETLRVLIKVVSALGREIEVSFPPRRRLQAAA